MRANSALGAHVRNSPFLPCREVLMTIGAFLFAVMLAFGFILAFNGVSRPKIQQELLSNSMFSWQRHRSSYIYTCETENCEKKSTELQRHVVWTRNPCDDFAAYACGTANSPHRLTPKRAAVEHFTNEIQHAIVNELDNISWMKKTPLIKNILSFYKTCLSDSSTTFSLDYIFDELGISQHPTNPAKIAGVLGRYLQLFPLFRVTVKNANGEHCFVLDLGEVVYSIGKYAPHPFSKDFPAYLRKSQPKTDEQTLAKVAKLHQDLYVLIKSPLISKHNDTQQTMDSIENSKFWQQYLNTLFESSSQIRADTCVVIKNTAYFNAINQHILQYSNKELSAYLAFRLTEEFSPMHNLLQGDQSTRKSICAFLTYKTFRFYFVKHYNNTMRLELITKTGLKEAIIRNSYRSLIDRSTALPSKHLNIVEDQLLLIQPEYFETYDVDVDSLYSSATTVPVDLPIIEKYVRLRKAFAPFVINAAFTKGLSLPDVNLDLQLRFDDTANQVLIPLSLTSLKLKGREFFIDMTSVGPHLVREYFRHFQEPHFEEFQLPEVFTKCLINQYEKSGKNLNVYFDFNRTKRENVADNLLLPVLHKAYHTSLMFSLNTSEALSVQRVFLHFKNLPNVSSDQLFFLMYAQNLCDHREDLVKVVHESPFSPMSLRINVPLMNFAPFAKAFNCPKDSAMNPTEKCLII